MKQEDWSQQQKNVLLPISAEEWVKRIRKLSSVATNNIEDLLRISSMESRKAI